MVYMIRFFRVDCQCQNHKIRAILEKNLVISYNILQSGQKKGVKSEKKKTKFL